MAACEYADYDYARIAELLLEAGADADATTDDGRTALSIALSTGYFETIIALIEHGAQVTENDMNAALDTGDSDLIGMLEHHRTNSLVQAIATDDVQTLRRLLDNGADADTRSGHDTLLMLASRDNKARAVRLLTELGADTEERNSYSEQHEK